ncbi:hypothetical protein FRB97_006323 [Tulasnella sp. 331]|nr:hypothetical protein FRB97_006323 [Tulasnella sp. 331]
MGIYSCITLYALTKLLIYSFFTEKVWIVWTPRVVGSSGAGQPSRWNSRVYRICASCLSVFGVILILMFLNKIAEIRRTDGVCVIGLQKVASLSLLSYDVFITTLLTTLFIYPLTRKEIMSQRLRRIALRTMISSAVALFTSVVNISVLTTMHGKQLGWICLTCCGADVTVNSLSLFWVTGGTAVTRNANQDGSPPINQNNTDPMTRPLNVISTQNMLGTPIDPGASFTQLHQQQRKWSLKSDFNPSFSPTTGPLSPASMWNTDFGATWDGWGRRGSAPARIIREQRDLLPLKAGTGVNARMLLFGKMEVDRVRDAYEDSDDEDSDLEENTGVGYPEAGGIGRGESSSGCESGKDCSNSLDLHQALTKGNFGPLDALTGPPSQPPFGNPSIAAFQRRQALPIIAIPPTSYPPPPARRTSLTPLPQTSNTHFLRPPLSDPPSSLATNSFLRGKGIVPISSAQPTSGYRFPEGPPDAASSGGSHERRNSWASSLASGSRPLPHPQMPSRYSYDIGDTGRGKRRGHVGMGVGGSSSTVGLGTRLKRLWSSSTASPPSSSATTTVSTIHPEQTLKQLPTSNSNPLPRTSSSTAEDTEARPELDLRRKESDATAVEVGSVPWRGLMAAGPGPVTESHYRQALARSWQPDLLPSSMRVYNGGLLRASESTTSTVQTELSNIRFRARPPTLDGRGSTGPELHSDIDTSTIRSRVSSLHLDSDDVEPPERVGDPTATDVPQAIYPIVQSTTPPLPPPLRSPLHSPLPSPRQSASSSDPDPPPAHQHSHSPSG